MTREPLVGACTGTEDPDAWFSTEDYDVDYAKSVCAGCPVRMTCFGDAVARKEPWGIWGGVIFGRAWMSGSVVREWAKDNGVHISRRGRVSSGAIAAHARAKAAS